MSSTIIGLDHVSTIQGNSELNCMNESIAIANQPTDLITLIKIPSSVVAVDQLDNFI